MFGHEKGAFTGAIAQKTGRFELADKGTLFLDEVGDIPLELQAKLLRVLQEQEFERLGSNRTHKVDVRLIAATHRDLPAMVKQGTFREDLYYRLKVFPIHVPALRDRTEDIPTLVRHFTALYSQRMNKRIDIIPPETMDALLRYPWPGNVRELQNFIERAVILSPQSVLRAPTSELEPFQADKKCDFPMNGLAEVERDHILRALEASNWVISGAAAPLRDEANVLDLQDEEASHSPCLPRTYRNAAAATRLATIHFPSHCNNHLFTSTGSDGNPPAADIRQKLVSQGPRLAKTPPLRTLSARIICVECTLLHQVRFSWYPTCTKDQ